MPIEASLASGEEPGGYAHCRVKVLRSAARVAYNIIAGDSRPAVAAVRACNINLARTLARNFSIDCIV